MTVEWSPFQRVEELARELGISLPWLRRQIASGVIPAMRIGTTGAFMVHTDDAIRRIRQLMLREANERYRKANSPAKPAVPPAPPGWDVTQRRYVVNAVDLDIDCPSPCAPGRGACSRTADATGTPHRDGV